MKKWFLSFLIVLNFTLASNGQNSDFGNLLEEGYTIAELENIYHNINVKNQKRWIERKGFKLVNHYKELRLYHYSKNSVVNLGVYYDRSETNISEVLFNSSPQKYYMALKGLEEDATYRKISKENVNSGSETGSMTKWAKKGYIYYARTDQWKIGMYKDHSNESAKSYSEPGKSHSVTPKTTATSSTSTSTNTAGSSSSTTSATAPASKVYNELSSLESIVSYLNSNIHSARLDGGKSGYEFTTLGRVSFDTKSIAFTVKNNQLFIKMHLPRNGECDYGIKEERAQLVRGETVTQTSYVTENGKETKRVYDGYLFKFDYDCNGTAYNRITVMIPEKDSDFWKALRSRLYQN